MGTKTSGSHGGVGDSSLIKIPSLSRQGSLYSLLWGSNQLGNLGKPFK